MRKLAHDYTGQKFNYFTILKVAGTQITKGGRKRLFWTVQCECGQTKDMILDMILRGTTKSCGCIFFKYKDEESIAYSVFIENYHDGDLSFEDFQHLTQQNCYLCGEWKPNMRKRRGSKSNFIFYYHGLDRLNNEKPHNRDNVQPCCWPCNLLRGKRTLPDFLSHIQTIYKNCLQEACQDDFGQESLDADQGRD